MDLKASLASLHEMALFVEIVRAGSFTQAGARLGIPTATISRRISLLEQDLGVRLFERSTRHLRLTPPASSYYERCAPIVDQARAAHEALVLDHRNISGTLRLSMPVDLGSHYLAGILTQFVARYPEVSFKIDLSPRFSDMFSDPIDLALRLGPVPTEMVVARYIGHVSQGVYASPQYLARHGRPSTPHDLRHHRCLYIPSSDQVSWRFPDRENSSCIEVPVKGPFAANNMRMLAALAQQDQGIAMLPSKLVKDSEFNQTLEQVLVDYKLPGWPLYAVTASRHQPLALRTFLDFLKEQWPNIDPGISEATPQEMTAAPLTSPRGR